MRRNKKHIYISFLLPLLLFNSQITAQESGTLKNIFFGDVFKQKNAVRSMSQNKNGELLYIQGDAAFLSNATRRNSNLSFNIIKDLSIPSAKQTRYFGDGKSATLINYTHLGEAVLGLSYKTTLLHRGPEFYFHRIDPHLDEKSNHGFPVSIFNSRFMDIDYARLGMVGTENAKYAGVIYFTPSKPNEHSEVKYAIFEDDYDSPQQNLLIYPFPSGAFEPLDLHIIDKETQLFFTGHYPKNNGKNRFRISQTFEYIAINHVHNNALKTSIIQIPDLHFIDIEVVQEEQFIYLIGMYTSEVNGSPVGIFSFQISLDGSVINEQFMPLPEIIIHELGEYQKGIDQNMRFSQVIEAKYNIIETHKTQEGLVLLAEFNGIENRQSGTDMPGSSTVIDTYYWRGSILACHFNYDGTLQWSTVLPKTQRTINDGGYYSSFSSHLEGDILHLFFNDNSDNYAEDNNYLVNTDFPDMAKFGNKNTIAHAELSIEHGSVKRIKTIGKNENGVIFVPQLSVSIPTSHKLFIYGVNGKKHRLGTISFYE